MQAVIMAGGEGIRLRPLTYVIPKPLLPLGNITILEYLIKNLSRNGFNEIFLMCFYQHEKFKSCLSYEQKYHIQMHIVVEEKRMGTAGGIFFIKTKLNDNFLVINGDLLVEMDFKSMFDFHLNQKADITIGATKFSFAIPHGVIELNENNHLRNITEKPRYSHLINSGIYILNQSVLGPGENGNASLDMPSLISLARGENKNILVYDIGDRWLDAGELDEYEKAVVKIEEWSKDKLL